MSATIIEPDYNWKQAATQEGVDYDAVKKAFMDQAYGVVANKAKVLFQDPFRLGFEIVHRNEKATKMVGIFAFRCNGALLYAPVFFVNGEIKSADMLYRSDVKRFVPLTDDWCAFLVRGANMEAGNMVEKSRQRQPEAYMDRLSYPQRIKYASEEGAGVLQELLSHCAADEAPGLLIPGLIDQCGPAALEKLAELIDNSDAAKRFICETYTEDQLSSAKTWAEKQAAERVDEDPYANSLVLITGLEHCKSASARESVVDHGYALIDNRPEDSFNVLIGDAESNTIHELPSPCVADVMTSDGKNVRALVLKYGGGELERGEFEPAVTCHNSSHKKPSVVYTPEDKEIIIHEEWEPVYGDEAYDAKEIETISADELRTGRTYMAVDLDEMSASGPVRIEDLNKDGQCRVISYSTRYGYKGTAYYTPDRKSSKGKYLSDNVRFIEVDSDIDKADNGDVRNIRPKWSKVLMDSAGIDNWMRTAGGMATSKSVEVRQGGEGLFTIISSDLAGMRKVAHDLGRLAAHLTLANDFELTCDQAGEILDKTVDDRVTRFSVYEPTEKSAFVTRMENMAPWIQGHDPELNVKLDAPQIQVLRTFTPQRRRQLSRYGDHWDRTQAEPNTDTDGTMPLDAVFSKSPEELAQLASQYQMPHIFDHEVLGRMATSMFNTVNQIQQYIPDLETGVDRYFRILFLLRYRPADFEEAYGKDELMEMEQEISELAAMAGENLLRLLKRFDLNKYTKQGL